jgi:hypothetical protein
MSVLTLYEKKHISLRFIDSDIRGSSILWWVSPYNLPRHHDATVYYWNHVRLGVGDEGFERVLHIIASDKPDVVFYSIAEHIRLGYSNREVPFVRRKKELDTVLSSARTRFIQLHRVPL